MADDDRDDDIERPASSLRDEDQLRRFKRWFRADSSHSSTWRKEAREDYDFVAGKQWTDQDKAVMEASGRVPIVFNRMLSIIKSVAGSEINNRQEIKYLPRENDDTGVTDVLNGASKWMGDETDAEDEQSEAFEDVIICGMGWTESRMDYELDPEGRYIEEKIDPLEMYWDATARKKNLVDARRFWRIRKVAIEDAKEMFPDASMDDLDAKWALGEQGEEAGTPVEERRFHNSGVSDDIAEIGLKEVTLVHLQWWEREKYAKIQDPKTGQPVDMDINRFKEIKKIAEKEGLPIKYAELTRRKYREAFIGGKILEMKDAPIAGHFSWACMTGEKDRNKGTFFGMARVMRDPQMWANKWLSQTLHIMNTTAKGGILAEKDAFDNQREAEETYAQPDAITFMRSGALSGQNPKIMPKPGGQFPAGFYNLVEFAISSIRDVTGVNLELLGMRDANQPGILEAQRKQAAMTILATLFNALRRYRKEIGRKRLYIIQNYLSTGRLIRIVGKSGQETVPLAKEQTTGTFDVIVDDSPSSPNQKEATWAAIIGILPAVQGMLTPEVIMTLLRYSPLPESLVTDLEELMKSSGQDPIADAAKEAALREVLAKVANLEANAEKSRAQAEKTTVETQLLPMEKAADAESKLT